MPCYNVMACHAVVMMPSGVSCPGPQNVPSQCMAWHGHGMTSWHDIMAWVPPTWHDAVLRHGTMLYCMPVVCSVCIQRMLAVHSVCGRVSPGMGPKAIAPLSGHEHPQQGRGRGRPPLGAPRLVWLLRDVHGLCSTSLPWPVLYITPIACALHHSHGL